MTLWKSSGALLLGAALLLALFATTESRASVTRLESPDEAECFEWKYPKEKECGKLSGKTECKSTPSIESSDDDDKKDKCKPKKGDSCTCE